MITRVVRMASPAIRTLAVGRRACTAAGARAMSTVLVDVQDRVATIRLNRPKQLNALNMDMAREFKAACEDLYVNCGDIGAVVVTGEGRAFSAGGDMKYLMDRHVDTPARNRCEGEAHFLAVRRIPVPVIAAINGPAIGAGLCMAMGCDVRIAAESASMGVTFVRLGLHPGMGATHFMTQIVGPQHAARMLLTGDVVSGTEAAAMGLVLKAVPDDTVVSEAQALATRMASQAPEAVRSCLLSLRHQQEWGLDRSLWREADSQAQNFGSSDYREGLAAIAEKRAPVFTRYDGYEFEVPSGEESS